MSKREHEKQLQEFINLKSNRIFSNSNKELFNLLLKIVFSNANSINWLISNPEKNKIFFSEENNNIIKKYIKSGKDLSLILIGNFDLIQQNLEELSKIYKNFKFKFISEKIKVQNILTWDEIGYRFTPDQHKLTSIACANDKEFTKKCNEIFFKYLRLNI